MTMLKENGCHWLIIDGSLGNVLISKQPIFNSIPESKIAHDQCVRKQMTELVVICKPPQYRKAPPLKWDPRPPQRSPHKLTTPNNQTRQAQLFPITKLKALPPKSVVDKILLLNQMHTLTFFSLLLFSSSFLSSLPSSFVKMYHWSLTVYFKW